MSEFKQQLYIINKFAGTDFRGKLEGRILGACEQNNIECFIEYTKGRSHATELARNGVQRNFDAIVAVGGDGTINEVARGMIGSTVPLGILPKGSGNGLARHLGISLKLEGALKNLSKGKVIRMDTFTLNGKLSLNVSGIGFDGHISNLFDKERQRGFWGYLRLVLKEYMRYQPFPSELILDEKTSHVNAFIIAIANSSQYGNNARISPVASVTDNLLDIVVVNKIKLAKGLPFAYRMITGTLSENSEYRLEVSKQMKVTTPMPVAYHVDGEPYGFDTEFDIRIQPHSLNIIVPAHGSI
jgi:YegS/Rv2252/BmrU family lipid kinase